MEIHGWPTDSLKRLRVCHLKCIHKKDIATGKGRRSVYGLSLFYVFHNILERIGMRKLKTIRPPLICANSIYSLKNLPRL
ncbi:hypothetical protein KL86DPRO_40079 [uncultured delta proteobacterium]|uniref:Uncharacterized protein n=1 Tax=uncultured delta proteobacterium TaxID=34034 RepID=A0A212K9H1_9DELT|nr:hypothetical protein KL86DPRO_40079 [uncultured delta proteobacterium]